MKKEQTMKHHKIPKYKKLLPIKEEVTSNEEIANFIEDDNVSEWDIKWNIDEDIYKPVESNMYYYRLISRILSYKVKDYHKFSTYHIKWFLTGFNVVLIAKKYKHLLFTKYYYKNITTMNELTESPIPEKYYDVSLFLKSFINHVHIVLLSYFHTLNRIKDDKQFKNILSIYKADKQLGKVLAKQHKCFRLIRLNFYWEEIKELINKLTNQINKQII